MPCHVLGCFHIVSHVYLWAPNGRNHWKMTSAGKIFKFSPPPGRYSLIHAGLWLPCSIPGWRCQRSDRAARMFERKSWRETTENWDDFYVSSYANLCLTAELYSVGEPSWLSTKASSPPSKMKELNREYSCCPLPGRQTWSVSLAKLNASQNTNRFLQEHSTVQTRMSHSRCQSSNEKGSVCP